MTPAWSIEYPGGAGRIAVVILQPGRYYLMKYSM